MATVSVQFTPLLGVKEDQPCCYTLEIRDSEGDEGNEVCILLDCGWNSKFDPSLLDPLEKVAAKVQLVLLSHPDLPHLGGLVYAWKHFNLRAPILCTTPVKEMGRLCLLDALDCHLNDHDRQFVGFDEKDIESCFASIIDVKYTERKDLSRIIQGGHGEGLVLQALNAGHLLGGAIYLIKARDTDSFIYAMDFNHMAEHHLDEAAFGTLQKPTLLITSASSAPRQISNVDRDKRLMDLTKLTIRQGGNVLIPIDGSGRVLELIHLFEKKWSANSGLAQYPVYLLHSVSEQTTEAAKRQIEWMKKTISADFDRTQNNPYDLKVVKTVKSLNELMDDSQSMGPKVVFASSGSLDLGPSRHLFQLWCRDPKNAVILVDSGEHGSVKQELKTKAELSKILKGPLRVGMTEVMYVPLEGEELEQHLDQKKKQAEVIACLPLYSFIQHTSRKFAITRIAQSAPSPFTHTPHPASALEQKNLEEEATREIDIDDVDSDMDDDTDDMEVEERRPSLLFDPQTLGSTILAGGSMFSPRTPGGGGTEKKGRKKRRFMFQNATSRLEWDEYGETIDINMYTSITSHIDPHEGLIMQPSQRDHRSGQLDARDRDFIPENSKRVERLLEVEVRCKVEFIDFEGLSNRESVQFKIDAMKPKKVIVVHTETECGQLLKQGLEMREVKTVLLPKQDETIDLAQDVSKFKVRLQEELYNMLDRHTIGQYEVAYLKSKFAAVDGHFQLQPPSDAGHPPVYVTKGELELSKVQATLEREQITSKFQKGVLTCDGGHGISLQKNSKHKKIHMKGSLSDDYFTVREVLYSKHTVL